MLPESRSADEAKAVLHYFTENYSDGTTLALADVLEALEKLGGKYSYTPKNDVNHAELHLTCEHLHIYLTRFSQEFRQNTGIWDKMELRIGDTRYIYMMRGDHAIEGYIDSDRGNTMMRFNAHTGVIEMTCDPRSEKRSLTFNVILEIMLEHYLEMVERFPSTAGRLISGQR